MPRPKPLPDTLDGWGFTGDDARSAGVPRSRLRARDVQHPHHGVNASRAASCPQTRASAYAPLLLPGQFFSHAFAAELWGLPLPRSLQDGPIHLSSSAPQRAPRDAGVIGHKLDGGHWKTVQLAGSPVSSALDVWCQLSTVLSVDQLVVIGDALVRRQQPLATMPQLVRGLARMHGRRGARRLREAYRSIRPGTDSPQETKLRLLLVAHGLPEPEINQAIFDESGTFLALGDLVYRDEQVLIEYDGAVHFASESQAFRDVDRLDRLMAAGWRVIRVNRTHMTTPSILADRITLALTQRRVANGYSSA